MAIATYSHQLHTRVRGSPPERRMPLLWERGNFKISDNQYATNLTSLDSDTSWRSVELLRLLLHLEGKLKTNFSYLTLQLTAVLVHEEASRSCLTWLMEAKILICPVKSKEHYSTFKAMCLQLGSLNHKSPRSSFLFKSPGVRDRQSLWDTQTNRGREREREDDPMSFPISFSCKMVSPEHSVLTLHESVRDGCILEKAGKCDLMASPNPGVMTDFLVSSDSIFLSVKLEEGQREV